VSADLLGLADLSPSLAELRRYSGNPRALTRFYQGVGLLDDWRLEDAETSLREAIALDSTFAMAHHNLALTLYWQWVRDEEGADGPEIGRHSATALRHAGTLTSRDSAHVSAFNLFQLGDYDNSRKTYRALIERDSTDVYAWVMWGSLEWKDPWIVEDEEGRLTPRSNLNQAVRAFTKTVQLSPGFHLGYGHLFDIQDRIANGNGRGFEMPRSELIAPWEESTLDSTSTFYGVMLDSIVWLDPESFRMVDQSTRREGAERLERPTVRLLRGAHARSRTRGEVVACRGAYPRSRQV